MKSARALILVVALFLVSSGFTMQSYKKHFSEDKTEVRFSHKQDFNELVKLKSDLAQKGIVVNYHLLQFDDNGKLKEIEFRVISEGIYRGTGISRVMTDESNFGFIIDRSPNAQFYFSVGNLWIK